MNIKRRLGFTIIELMVAISVAMIVLGIGVPNFVGIIRSNDTVAEVNDLATALNLARSEAVGRGVEVMITPRSGSDWTTGWIVGIDLDEDDVFPELGEPVLRTFSAVESLTFTASPVRVEFKPTGEVSALTSFAMLPAYCDDVSNRQRVLSVAMAGYVDLRKQSCP
jgi:type IV fimbrial biogenesis protein FimT